MAVTDVLVGHPLAVLLAGVSVVTPAVVCLPAPTAWGAGGVVDWEAELSKHGKME